MARSVKKGPFIDKSVQQAVERVALELQDPRDSVADDRGAEVPDVHLLGQVRAGKVHDDALRRVRPGNAQARVCLARSLRCSRLARRAMTLCRCDSCWSNRWRRRPSSSESHNFSASITSSAVML